MQTSNHHSPTHHSDHKSAPNTHGHHHPSAGHSTSHTTHKRPRRSSLNKLKLIGGTFLLVLLLVGGIAGFYLSQQTQELRQQASGGVTDGPFTENFAGGTPPGAPTGWVTNESSTWNMADWGKNNGNFRIIRPKAVFTGFPNPPTGYVTDKYLELIGLHGDTKPTSRYAVCRDFPANTFQTGRSYRFTTYTYIPNNSAPPVAGEAVGILSDGRKSDGSVALQRFSQADLAIKNQWQKLEFDITYPSTVAVGENNRVNLCFYVNRNQTAIFSGFTYQ
jgi:hypothetical protein